MKRSTIGAVGLIAACVVLVGVSIAAVVNQTGKPPAGPAGAGIQKVTASDGSVQEFNATDVMFLQMMVPHHGLGVAVAALAATHPVRADIKLLAGAIESTQRAEIESMAGWLSDWKQPPTAAADSHASHGGAPTDDTTGLDQLAKVPDAEFERIFLSVLVDHQRDARNLAKMETESGVNPLVRELAARIDASRAAQVEQMQTYLDTTP